MHDYRKTQCFPPLLDNGQSITELLDGRYFENIAAAVESRIVRRLNPDLLATLADAQEFVGHKLLRIRVQTYCGKEMS